MPTKTCLHCHTPLKGRSDKKFCDSYCRTAFHNNSNNQTEKMIRAVNRRLRLNRSVLKKLCPEGKATVTREVLLNYGFSFTYFTSVYHSKRATYYFCYEYGYATLANKSSNHNQALPKVLIVQKQDYKY